MTTYHPEGVCATEIRFEIVDDILAEVEFVGGCNGNLKAISTLIKGMKATEVIGKLKGNTCESNPTSCTDQLARALEQALTGK